MKFETEPLPSVPPSEDRETEWKDDVEEAETWPWACRRLDDELLFAIGGYVCSTVREFDDDRLGTMGGVVNGERDFEELAPELFEVCEVFRGGNGGAMTGFYNCNIIDKFLVSP